MSDPRHSVSVSGVITDDGGRALLVQRRDNGRWEPPGGRLELSESITCGLRREIREETGLDIEPLTLTGVYKNMSSGIVALVFRCKTAGGRLTENNEAAGFRWATRNELSGLVAEAFAVRVLDALDGSSHEPTIREHDGTHLL